MTEEATSSCTVLLHPLVIINISDHATRDRVQNNGVYTRVIGALLGNQVGKTIEVSNSFELVTYSTDNQIAIDEKYLKNKLDQFSQVFKTLEFLGWYSSGSAINIVDVEIQKQLMPFNENPIYLLIDTIAASTSRELPISFYESEVRIVDDQPRFKFVTVPYKIETLEAERVAVDHVAHAAASTGVDKPGASSMAHFSGLHEAIRMLHIRIQFVLKYLESVKQGEQPIDHAVLRKIKGTCNLLPAINTNQFKSDLLDEYNNTLLITYLSSITKSVNFANEVADATSLAYDNKFPGGRKSRITMGFL